VSICYNIDTRQLVFGMSWPSVLASLTRASHACASVTCKSRLASRCRLFSEIKMSG